MGTVVVHLSDDQLAAVRQRADEAGVDLPAFVRKAAVEAAPHSVGDRDRLGRPLSHRNQVIAARIRLKVDPVRGVDTPRWIRDFAE